ncbi:GCN5-related N-acetyltransferase [Trichormus variabilis ATCC 29413]|uniref:GCN5-related N-acetyltransferase n=2 Tax=Anabaena variabilis TaxID=264691 RepID=Q3MDS3_TRIV2|nr:MULTISPECIES: GNAT family N-acetyltransferase [Nostocaceae]ABA20863.1 GCN5-related N-acetyltransferase [Trichormus variabilis ATCC 29413]MBC1217478.1 GNAT family N-acetyltransferase [Trichormus variabilis ARAD]MBC1255894.1 GNAT family N-acetyltransferase [Trichormus variabilis V5]MBC1266595.1 GNAT family N-acetyltransferase [Trichormus variabilis FSR]MBC1302981.1 GNAT family N-acetyltransferase [Trichormus variabilis N2B]
MKPPQTLATQRLSLRQPVAEDAALIFTQYAQDPEVAKYTSWQTHKSIKETDEFINRCTSVWANVSAFPYVLIRKEDAQLIGMVEIRINQFKAELGYVLTKSEWGKGYMPEAVQALTDWALGQNEIYRVWAVCDVENQASKRVMEKVGMHREGVLERWFIHPNMSQEPRDCYCYAVTK